MALLSRRHERTWDPFAELREMSNRLNRVFAGDSSFEPSRGEGQALAGIDWAPSVNISETDKAYLIKVDLPDLKKDDVKVSCDKGMLTVEGERKQQKTEENERYHRIESSYGRFVRRFTLPEDADMDAIDANHKDGALTVRIPKAPARTPSAKQIKVG